MNCHPAAIGIDVAKLRNTIAIADSGREGEVRFFGEVDASDQSMHHVIQRIAGKFDRVHFCYEAGPTGYGLYRPIRSLGHECMVVAPSLIPRMVVTDQFPVEREFHDIGTGRRFLGSGTST